jgi:hypothetical protein
MADGIRHMLLIGISKGRLRFRLLAEYGGWGRVRYLDSASNDLKCLAMLWIGHLVPSGVLADKWEEEVPQYREVPFILRLYDEIVAEMQSKEQPK